MIAFHKFLVIFIFFEYPSTSKVKAMLPPGPVAFLKVRIRSEENQYTSLNASDHLLNNQTNLNELSVQIVIFVKIESELSPSSIPGNDFCKYPIISNDVAILQLHFEFGLELSFKNLRRI